MAIAGGRSVAARRARHRVAPLQGVQHGQAKLDDFQPLMAALADTFDKVAAGQSAFFSWQDLIAASSDVRRQTRRILIVQPVMDFSALQPGAGGEQRDPRDGPLARPRSDAHGVTHPADGAGAAGRRGVRVAGAGLAPGRRGDGDCAAGHPVVGRAFGPRGGGDPAGHLHGPDHDGRARAAGDRPLQPDLGRLHPAVRRARHRLQHPVQRAFPRRAASPSRRSATPWSPPAAASACRWR